MRWFTDVSTWEPTSPAWHAAMQLLPLHEQEKVLRFVFAKDQRLALASRLLQRQLISAQCGSAVPLAQIDIQRTPENKPFWQRRVSESNACGSLPATWNYNVSHHGTVVAIASHPHRLVGVDVVQISERPRARTSASDFFHAFANHFTEREWMYIHGCSAANTSTAAVSNSAQADDAKNDDDDPFVRFYRLWSLKEAYIKAVGIGLGFTLLRAEFAFNTAAQTWQLRLDGALALDWRFECYQLDAAHLVSVALGPVDALWRPTTSSIFATSIVAVAATSAQHSDTVNDTADDDSITCIWEHKDLASLCGRGSNDARACV